MFTGIIEEVGIIRSIKKQGLSSTFTISADIIFSDLKTGDSVSVNGVCLTAWGITKNSFSADIMNETLSRSSLGNLSIGSKVNLERAMPLNGRFGGHIVSGHIDGLGTIRKIVKDYNAIRYTISTQSDIIRYIIYKGSIAIDGISLTVAEVSKNDFMVSVIPHTLKNTVLYEKKIGDIVNLENDMIGKYVEKLLTLRDNEQTNSSSGISKEFLSKYSF